tara:strand:- start:67 stop:534 length:468 start_codon:yes stop_codon:yes gene_type:complete
LSYFAKPNFIVYDDWFDEDLENAKLDIKNKKIKTNSTIHEFFYQKSNYKVGASENNLQLEIKVIGEKLITNNYLENTSAKNTPISNKKFRLFEKLTKSLHKFSIKKKIIYSFSIFSFLIIFGCSIFYIYSSRKSKSTMTNRSLSIEKILIFKSGL